MKTMHYMLTYLIAVCLILSGCNNNDTVSSQSSQVVSSEIRTDSESTLSTTLKNQTPESDLYRPYLTDVMPPITPEEEVRIDMLVTLDVWGDDEWSDDEEYLEF